MQHSPQHFFAPLESLRGLAALCVMLLHLPLWHNAFDVNFLHNSTLMVQFFFVLSGFVIFHSYGEKIASTRDAGRFMWLRFGRLYPVHLVFLIGFIGIECVKLIAVQYGLQSPNTRPFEDGGIGVIVQHLFLVHSLGFTGDAESFNIVSWSISTEFYTYILFAFAVMMLSRRAFLIVAGVVACAAISVWAYHAYDPYPFKRMLSCLAGFCVGCLTYEAYRAWGTQLRLCGAGMFSLLAFIFFLSLKTPHIAADVAIYPLSALLIFCVAAAPQSAVVRGLNLRPLRFLGMISYALYMAHPLVIWVANQVVRVVLRVPERMVGGGMVPELSTAQAWVIYPAVVALVLAVSTLTYYLIEAPCRHYSRKRVGV